MTQTSTGRCSFACNYNMLSVCCLSVCLCVCVCVCAQNCATPPLHPGISVTTTAIRSEFFFVKIPYSGSRERNYSLIQYLHRNQLKPLNNFSNPYVLYAILHNNIKITCLNSYQTVTKQLKKILDYC